MKTVNAINLVLVPIAIVGGVIATRGLIAEADRRLAEEETEGANRGTNRRRSPDERTAQAPSGVFRRLRAMMAQREMADDDGIPARFPPTVKGSYMMN